MEQGYFRVEARELLDELGQGALDLEKGTPAPDLVARLLRFAHTLKGAARVVRQREIAEQAHAVEDVLAVARESSGPLSRDRIDLILSLVDDMGRQVATLTPAPGQMTVGPERVRPEEPFRTFRPDLSELDGLLDGVADAHAQLGALRPKLEQVERARHLVDLLVDQLARPRVRDAGHGVDAVPVRKARSMADELVTIFGAFERDLAYSVDRIDSELRQVRDTAERLRLIPAGALFSFLERAARDAAHAEGKQVVFEGHGGDVRVDAVVLDAVQGALIQAVRNAVAHGIEPARERQALGKPPEGRVTLNVVRRGRWVIFGCTDDGRGVDLAAVRRALERKGLISAESLDFAADAVLRLLFRGGISTSSTITDVSGRGVGLDVVRETAERVGGEATMVTEAGRGTTIELRVPLSLASVQALVVKTTRIVAAIPLDAVRGAMRVTPEEIARTGHAESVRYDGTNIPFASLLQTIAPDSAVVRVDRALTAVIVEGESGLVAFGVDQVVGTAAVVSRPFTGLTPATDVVAGASFDASGDPQLLLDPDGLVVAAQHIGAPGIGSPSRRRSILVVDDSLTTRMLEQSILESAGYDVELASSGEEGLEKAKDQRHALFLVDVEMPGMDGFTFIERVRADPTLQETPSILVTSRASLDDRRRGRDVGALGYIVKGEFDQGELLECIRSLVMR